MRRRHASALILALCGLLSGLWNFGMIAGILWLIQPEELPEAERITYLDLTRPLDASAEQRKEEKREPERQRDEPEPPDPQKKKKKKELKKPKPEIELEELPEPEPEEEKKEEEKEEEKPKEEPEPVDFVMEQLKMVEQPDELDEQEVPDDVNYLSNINRNVVEETRAKVTNLEKDAIKPEARQIEPTPEKQPGTAAEQKIAQLEQQESQLNRQAPDVKPSPEQKRPEQNDPKPQSMLAMRELEHRDHRMAQEKFEPLASEADDGRLRAEQQHQSSLEKQEAQARIEKNDEVYKFKLSHKDLDALFGKDIDAQKAHESKKQSKTKGVWEDARAHWQSPLENMVPEVQPGNQTALRSRKHPFARYIATMHRKIHEAWAWGYLDQLDTRGRNHPLNDYELWTRLEIVLNSDGTVDKVINVRHSGKLVFDAAAREIIYAAGPFPNPPAEIISGNGKIYIHWAFHRDERACGTFGAQPFILDSAGRGDRPDANVRVRPGRGGERLSRRSPGGGGGSTSPRAKAPKVAEGPAPPPGSNAGHDHAHGGPAPGPRVTPEEAAADPKARKVANEWLHYFSKGQVDRTVARSTLPFYAGDTIVARTRPELREILGSMADEAKAAGRPKAAKVYTAAGLRKVWGSVPAGVSEGSSRVYAITKIGGDYYVLILEKKFGSWRVTGTTR